MLQSYETRTLRPLKSGSSLKLTDITARATRLEAYDGHERIWLGEDHERGLTAIVAIHNTALGPALGGTRVWPHPTFEAALTDALRLSRGMTYKAAITNMPYGGGKAVIVADPRTDKTPAMLEAYAEMLAALNGQYFTGEDVGLTLADADFLRARTPNVTGTTIGGSGNPSPVTAQGVFLGIKAALRHRNGNDAMSGLRIAVQGLGSVGWSLCEKLHAEGASLVVADLDEARVRKAMETFHAEAVAGDAIVAADVDLFAPCALGGILSADTIPTLKAKIVAGAANNQLERHEDARRLMAQGVLYAPDYVINAGGLINVATELDPDGYDREAAMTKVELIPQTLSDIFRRADSDARPTNDIAQAMGEERIARARAA
ncbi:Glu/Leu/Phe/Val dehydrogenase dimerization domain-containing protein [Aquamicrobium sp. LC103]|uniref:Glu/Leu/Phe/Val family dehydrogenase n=1 Tax=Aquamicrobium sp. LC103 TaxID=1120658 RepID=UPI0010C93E02|nr:Glu/Leu/Phe/Val dehydrogenase dimerization domain-containing protein [Aquamicrobium sp. LC103]TKT82862.1 Glu/Leu/Phe/Val dehydrogenase [Aquamicrobium sp. LC103]